MLAKQISTKWVTVATIGFSHGVARHENRAAHGGVCHLQARRGARGLLGRKVNSNGRHQEVGEAAPLSESELAHWQAIERSSR